MKATFSFDARGRCVEYLHSTGFRSNMYNQPEYTDESIAQRLAR